MPQTHIAANPVGYEQITDVSSAVGFTIPAGTSHVIVNVEAQAVRWRDDGTDPTASVGMRLEVGDSLEYDSRTLGTLKFIEEVSGAILNVSYYGG